MWYGRWVCVTKIIGYISIKDWSNMFDFYLESIIYMANPLQGRKRKWSLDSHNTTLMLVIVIGNVRWKVVLLNMWLVFKVCFSWLRSRFSSSQFSTRWITGEAKTLYISFHGEKRKICRIDYYFPSFHLQIMDYNVAQKLVLIINVLICASYPFNFAIYCGMSK